MGVGRAQKGHLGNDVAEVKRGVFPEKVCYVQPAIPERTDHENKVLGELSNVHWICQGDAF